MSKRLGQLEQGIRELREQFLPDPFDPLGQYRDGQRAQAHTRAFLVLSYAEFESFLEEWAKELARSAEKLWSTRGRIAVPLSFLLSWYDERLAPSDSMASPGAKDSHQRLADIVSKLFPANYKRVKDNHGVKDLNVLRLFGPLGVPSSAFGTTLLPSLDDLGTVRGAHAHHSARAVLTPLDPETEFKKVDGILRDLRTLDAWLVSYMRKVR